MPKSAALNADENGLLGDFQMPMYVTLAGKPVEAAYFYAIQDAKRTCAVDDFTGLSKEKMAAGVPNPKHSDVFTADTVAVFSAYVRDFAARVQESRFAPVVPAQKQGAFVHVEPYSVCAACHCKGMCRTTFTVGARDVARTEGV